MYLAEEVGQALGSFTILITLEWESFGLVLDTMGKDTLSGVLFLIADQIRTRLGILLFQGGGLGVCRGVREMAFGWLEDLNAVSFGIPTLTHGVGRGYGPTT